MININDLLNVRFSNHGRNIKEGFDCYGLAIEVSRRFGHNLIDLWYSESTSEMFTQKVDEVRNKLGDLVSETKEQEEGNLIIFSDNKGNMIHIGVILEKGIFIHSSRLNGVKITKLEDYFLKQWKVYKWQK